MTKQECKCGRILTEEEIDFYNKTCLQCFMISQKAVAQGLGADFTNLLEDPELFGRTQEEFKEFYNYVQKNVVVEPKKVRNTEHDQIKELLSNSDKEDKIKLTVFGANEDIKLSLELPKTYPIPDPYFAKTKELLNIYLETVVHFLAFAPLTNSDLETYLAQKLGLERKNKGDY